VKHLSMRLPATLGLLLLVNGPAFAGTVYSFVTETRDGFNDQVSEGDVTKGRVIVDGEKFRTEREENDPLIGGVVVSKDGGEHRFLLNPEARTFFELQEIEGQATSPLFQLFPVPIKGERLVENVKVETRAGTDPETMAGSAVRRREITVSYDLTIKIAPPEPPPGRPPAKGPLEIVRGKVKADAVYWMAEDKAPLPANLFAPDLRTGFPEVDGKLAAALSALHGLAVKQQVTVSTEGGSYMPARSSTVTTTVEGPKPFNTQAALFVVPSGFRMHKPEITGPGLSSAPMPFPGAEGPP
jgi:hypothetical protein